MIETQVQCWSKQCRWFVGVARQGGPETPLCGAFPDGIPKEIAYGENIHDRVVPGQAKLYTYEKDRDWQHHYENLPEDDAALWQRLNEPGSPVSDGMLREEQEKKDATTLSQLAKELINAKQWQRARLVAEHLVSLRPRDPAAYLSLAMAHLGMNDLARAEQCVRHALELGAETPENFLLMARLCRWRHDAEGQLLWARKAAECDPENPEHPVSSWRTPTAIWTSRVKPKGLSRSSPPWFRKMARPITCEARSYGRWDDGRRRVTSSISHYSTSLTTLPSGRTWGSRSNGWETLRTH